MDTPGYSKYSLLLEIL